MARILMVVAQQGFRDEELLVPREILEAEGHKITLASLSRGRATGVLGASVNAEMSVHEANPAFFDAIVIVGGPGSGALAESEDVLSMLRKAAASPRTIVAAICIAPMALANAGVLTDRKATVCRTPESVSSLKKGGAVMRNEPVVRDGNILTANGPAAAESFARQLAGMLKEKKGAA